MALFAQYKSGAKRRMLDFAVEPAELKALFQSRCSYCSREPNQVKRGRHTYGDFVYNGVDRIDSSRGYVRGNVVACCKTCNVAKARMSHSEFIEHCRGIAASASRLP